VRPFQLRPVAVVCGSESELRMALNALMVAEGSFKELKFRRIRAHQPISARSAIELLRLSWRSGFQGAATLCSK